MNVRSNRAMGLHALAHDYATGRRPIGIRWYTPDAATLLQAVPVLPDAVHGALCPAYATLLHDANENLIICAECKLAVDLQDAA